MKSLNLIFIQATSKLYNFVSVCKHYHKNSIKYMTFILIARFNSTAINDYVFFIDKIWVLKGKVRSNINSTET